MLKKLFAAVVVALALGSVSIQAAEMAQHRELTAREVQPKQRAVAIRPSIQSRAV